MEAESSCVAWGLDQAMPEAGLPNCSLIWNSKLSCLSQFESNFSNLTSEKYKEVKRILGNQRTGVPMGIRKRLAAESRDSCRSPSNFLFLSFLSASAWVPRYPFLTVDWLLPFSSRLCKTWWPAAPKRTCYTLVTGRDQQESRSVPILNHLERSPGWLEFGWVVLEVNSIIQALWGALDRKGSASKQVYYLHSNATPHL